MREEEEATTRKEEHTVRRVADEPGLSETYKEQLRKEFGYSEADIQRFTQKLEDKEEGIKDEEEPHEKDNEEEDEGLRTK